MRRSLFARGFSIVAMATVSVTLVVVLVGIAISGRMYVESNAAALERAAFSLAEFLPANRAQYDDFSALAASRSGFRITLVEAKGAVLADSEADVTAMENHGNRSEIASALAGKSAWTRRRSSTLGQWMLYAAIPVKSATGENLALRLALPLPSLMERIGAARWSLAIVAVALLVAAMVASAWLMRMLARPITILSENARLFAESGKPGEAGFMSPAGAAGKLGEYLPVEFEILGEALDSMATNLTKKAMEAGNLSLRYSAILRSAGEGILAVDRELVVTEANPAAHELLGAASGTLCGATLASASGSEAIIALARDSMESGKPASAEISLYGRNERTLKASASPFDSGAAAGAVIAISDITVLKRLERVRTDFVANVSHELRTPIQLIRGFAETTKTTLSEKRIDGDADLIRYLDIIEKHAIRMERIVSDLLSLARLERDRSTWLTVEPCHAASLVNDVIAISEYHARARNIALDPHVGQDFVFSANSGLIEQALTNLAENAIRYSRDGQSVVIQARLDEGFAEFQVRDRGVGIPAPDLERIFERFYRADKSRDRKSGGTGLGLAIVSHIATAHGGSVKAESRAGEGSVFTLRVPAAGPDP